MGWEEQEGGRQEPGMCPGGRQAAGRWQWGVAGMVTNPVVVQVS